MLSDEKQGFELEADNGIQSYQYCKNLCIPKGILESRCHPLLVAAELGVVPEISHVTMTMDATASTIGAVAIHN